IVHDWDDAAQVEWLHGAGIRLLRGHARVTGERAVTVTTAEGETTELVARHAVVIATGSDPTMPDIAGLLDAQPWTSRDATSTRHIPLRLAVVGGGVVAAELATAFASLGSAVTVFARSGMLSGFEDFAGELVTAGL